MHSHPMTRLVGATLAIGLIQIMLGSPALAVTGDLDPTFSGDGRVTTGFPGGADASGVAVQADGKIVTAGQASDPTTGDSTFALARYRPNGALDPTFSGDGKVTTEFPGHFADAFGLALQQDGKIVAAGEGGQGFALARYNTDGTLDLTFGDDGKVTTGFATGAFANAVVVQQDDKIVAVGRANFESGDLLFALARYRPNGTLDPTFSRDGKVTTAFAGGLADAFDLALQQDGKIVVAGSASDPTFQPRFALARYRTDGFLDPTFSGDGKVITEFPGHFADAFGVALQQDGRIVVAGDTRPGSFDFLFALARYRPDGTLDPTFGGDGRVTTGFGPSSAGASGASDVGIQTDGKIVAAGSSFPSDIEAKFALARYRSDGTLDPAFSGDGRVTTSFPGNYAEGYSLAIQVDGKVVAAGRAFVTAGTSRLALARYLGL